MDSGSDSDSESRARRGHSESVGLTVTRLEGTASASASATGSASGTRTHRQARHGWPGGRPSQAQAASQGGLKLSRRRTRRGYHKTLSLHRASDSGSQRRTVTRRRPGPGALDLLREELALGCEAMTRTRMPTAANSDSESEPT
jgi:hypothetical protein